MVYYTGAGAGYDRRPSAVGIQHGRPRGGNDMRKCKDCGAEITGSEAHRHEDICPSCGLAGGAQAITDLPPASIKKSDRILKEEIEAKREGEQLVAAATCRNCGAEVTGLETHRHDDACPSCGLAGGIAAMTDLPPASIRQAQKKLKAEIKEIKEQKKRGET